LTPEELDEAIREAAAAQTHVEEFLIEHGIPDHEILFCLSEYYGLPFVEYDEEVAVSQSILKLVDFNNLMKSHWIPLSVVGGEAEVIAYRPGDPELEEEIKSTLGVTDITYNVALPGDIKRIIENNYDLNPDFPPTAGRTPLAKVRTFLAGRRSRLAAQRTSLAKGRTGLAFLRTGIAFIAIGVTFFRVFGLGYLTAIDALLMIGGVVAVVDGLIWYLPARRNAKEQLSYQPTVCSLGFSVIEVTTADFDAEFHRSDVVESAKGLRRDWDKLSPVQRRRFLANDRTDMAEERTSLASLRTDMAKARTGLAFARTGIAFAGLGIGLMRHFVSNAWTVFDVLLIVVGTSMLIEGILWYFPGRSAAVKGLKAVKMAEEGPCIWDAAFPPFYRIGSVPPVRASHAPGVWATTGLALERTVLADRRNVMMRLRTIMARARTAMAFIRTGISVTAVGAGLLIYFGLDSLAWTVFDSVLIAAGLALIADGARWHAPADKIKRSFPYCFGDFEISIPDYSVPGRFWKKVHFSHDDI